MRVPIILVLFTSTISSGSAQPTEPPLPTPAAESKSDTVEYFDARGRLIGSVAKIGGVTYFISPDGSLQGTAETVLGHRVFKNY